MNPIEKTAASHFQTPEHNGRMGYAESREKKRLNDLFASNPELAISDAMGTMFCCCLFFKTIGMKKMAIMILKQALVFVRSGTEV